MDEYEETQNEKRMPFNFTLDDDDCTVDSELAKPESLPETSEPSTASDPEAEGGITLEPNHPLLAKFQQSLKEQLLKQVQKLEDECNELNISIKKKSTEKDSLGLNVYEAQQAVTHQQELVEKLEKEIQEMIEGRSKIETENNELLDIHKMKNNELNELRKKETELRTEEETLSYMMTQMSSWVEQIQAELAVSKRIADKTKRDKKQFTEEKRNLDFIIYKLMTEVFRLENSINLLNMQLKVKDEQRDQLGEQIVIANTEYECLQAEYRRLIHSWNSVLVAIGQRDKTYGIAKEELRDAQEQLRCVINEIAMVRKESIQEMSKNEQLCLQKGRIELDISNLNDRLLVDKNKLLNLENQLNERHNILLGTQNDLASALEESKMKKQDYNNLLREIAKKTAQKADLEEKNLQQLQEQIKNDKITKYMNKMIRDQREKNRNLEITFSEIDNTNAEVLVDIERQKHTNCEIQKMIDELKAENRMKEKEISKKQMDINNTKTEMGKKQRAVDSLSNKIEEIIRNSGGVEMTPLEIKNKALEKQIAEVEEKNNNLQSFWLRLQNNIIQLSDRRQEQMLELNLLRKQSLLTEQKNLKLEDELEHLSKVKQKMKREIHNLQVKFDRLNSELVEKQNMKDNLSRDKSLLLDNFMEKLQSAEMDCLKLEMLASDLEDEKETLSKDLIDINRETLAWETKLQMAFETKDHINKAKKATGELGQMQTEIHRMNVRFSQLKKVQERLVEDLQHCLLRRESIMVNAEAVEKVLQKHGAKVDNKQNFKRKIQEMKNKIKKIEVEKKKSAEKINLSKDLEVELNEKLEECTKTIDQIKVNTDTMIGHIEVLKLERTTELELLVFKQHQLRAWQNIYKYTNEYKMHYKTPAILNHEYQKAVDTNQILRRIAESLLIEFPNHYTTFSKILFTLKVVPYVPVPLPFSLDADSELLVAEHCKCPLAKDTCK